MMLEELQRYFLWCVRSDKDLNRVVELAPEAVMEEAKKLAEEEEQEALCQELVLTEISTTPSTETIPLSQQVESLLSHATERQTKVLRLRFGLEDACPRSLEEVGKEFDVTRERIRQIQVKALHALRRHHRAEWRRTHLV